MGRLLLAACAALRRGGLYWALALAFVVAAPAAHAEGITLKNARVEAVEEGWQLDAEFDIQFSPRLEETVNRGVPLYFVLDFEMSRPRWETRSEFAPIRFVLHADCKAHVKADPVELREVLVNMVYNAVDAMPSGGEIRVSVQESRERVVMSIADTGTGMTPEVKKRLFDPFFTTKGKAGTGMGLAVSFGIIRRHEGSIDVESEPGRGTTFRISLPKVVSEPARSLDGDITKAESQVEGKVRVLVVDDETHVRDVLKEALEAEGCEVLTAQSGDIALSIFDQYQGKVDAVFTDIGMPDMSGWELVNEIRQRSKDLPLAIISGWADAISVEQKNAVSADWVIAKPFDIDKIGAIANEIAERRRARDLVS